VAVATARAVVMELPVIREVIFCCFSKNDLAVYERVLASGAGTGSTGA
jgi:hypothetical protein